MRAVILVGLAAALAGCGNRNNSIVVVTLTGSAPLAGIHQVRGTATAGGRDVPFSIAAPSGTVATPFTFGIEVPYNISGNMTVHCDVYDVAAALLASGDGMARISAGGRSDMTIALVPVGGAIADMAAATPPPDMAGPATVTDMVPPPPDLELPAMLSIDTNLQKLGPVTQGKVSAPAQFTVTNSGTVPALMPQLSSSGDTGDFDISTDCGTQVAPYSRCHVNVDFAPKASSAAGAKDLKFTLAATSGGSVMGEATGTALTPGQISITSPANATGSCGASLLTVPSTMQASFTVHNGGATATGTLSVTLSDTQFSSTGCTGALQPGADCTLTVSFTPQKRGSFVCSIVVGDSPSDQATASVNGTGQVAAIVNISPATFKFPGGPRGSAAQSQAFTISNSGDLPTNLLQAAATTNTAFAVTNDTCNGKQLGATPCSVTVQFTPPATGTTTGQLQISDGTSTLQTADLSGVGTPIWVRELSTTTAVVTPSAFHSVWITPDGKYVFAGGDGDLIYGRTTGGSWSKQNLVSNNTSAGPVTSLSGSSLADMWAVDGGIILRSTGNGTWTYQTTYAPTGLFVSDVFVVAAGDVWIVGRTQTTGIGHYVYDSYQWVSSNNSWSTGESNAGCARLWGSSDTDLFCAFNSVGGSAGTSGFNPRSGGASPWSVVDTFYSSSIGTLNGTTRLWGTSPTDIYIGITDTTSLKQRPFHYTGGTPTQVDISAMTDAWAVWEADSTHVIFGGATGVQLGDGSTWGTAVDPLGKSFFVKDIRGTSVNDYYAVGSDSDGMAVYHWF